MIKLLKYLGKKQWMLAAVCVLLIFGQVWLELKMPDYMSEITVLVQTEGSKMSEIIKNGAYMLTCALASLIDSIVVGYIISNMSATFSKKVRKKLFDKVENLSMNEVKNFSTSSLITRTTNDITQIQMCIGTTISNKSTNHSNLGNNKNIKQKLAVECINRSRSCNIIRSYCSNYSNCNA